MTDAVLGQWWGQLMERNSDVEYGELFKGVLCIGDQRNGAVAGRIREVLLP